jgi:hypothetical protein
MVIYKQTKYEYRKMKGYEVRYQASEYPSTQKIPVKPRQLAVTDNLKTVLPAPVAYPGIYLGGGGVQQIQLRTDGRENG